MLINVKAKHGIKESEITDESVFNQRRRFLKKMGFIGAGGLMASSVHGASFSDFFSQKNVVKPFVTSPLGFKASKVYSASSLSQSYPNSPGVLTPEAKVISHNNFYEFGTNKSDPQENAQNFKVNPWQLSISGECGKPFTLGYDDLFTQFPLEERIYRMRCVEAWSMVIPWIGFSLAEMIKKAQPTSKAKYVAFETLYDPKQMPGQQSRRVGGGIDYPYVEGLRIDEAMNSLTFMSVGLYGKTLPAQNGAPVRLVVPWKYGFKSIKSVVNIRLVEHQPPTTWNILAPNEYGFYANVNPAVDHPRWSQASERRITTGGLLARNRIETLPFNGYGEEVAHLYKNMNLKQYY